tara:strand:- start:2624 stop:3871 length:1248 start_codon:yes stop_codon:yes gene_type:complete
MPGELTVEQQTARDAVVSRALGTRDLQVLTGPGGSGKSFVMSAVADRLKVEGWCTLFATMSHSALASCPLQQPRLVLAKLIVQCGWKGHPNKTPAERKIAQWFRSTRRVLVVDEAFQLRADYIQKLFSALQGYSSVVRGGVRVILVGDPGQMKPIGGEPITKHPDVARAKWTRLTSGTMRMTADWAQDVASFDQNALFADASLGRHRRQFPRPGAMIITPTRKDAIDATRRYLAGPQAVTILPTVPESGEGTDPPTSEVRKASEPFICDPEQAARLVYNVRDADGARTTPSGFGLNNNSRVRFAGLVDKDGDHIAIAPGATVRLTKEMRVRIRVEGEDEPIQLAPVVVDDIVAVPLRPYGVKTVHAAQGETIDGGVFLHATGPVKQSVYVTAAGRVRCAEKFSVSPEVTSVQAEN